MRTTLLFMFAFSLMLLTGCENDSSAGPSSRFSVQIAGTAWNASQVFANELSFGGSSTRVISATGPNNETFSITVVSTSTGNLDLGSSADETTASVTFTRNNTVYSAVSGNMSVTNNNDGNFSATFSGSLQSPDGSVTLGLTSGSIVNVRTLN